MLRIFCVSVAILSIIYAFPIIDNYMGDKIEIEVEEVDLLEIFDFEKIEDVDQIIATDTSDSIIVSMNGKNVEMDTNEFLIGVVAGEMPASFEDEALKAQAVAARTYIYYKQWLIDNGRSDNVHPGAVVCTNSAHCKAHINLDTYTSWGDMHEFYETKITRAVYSTGLEYITYDEIPIAAVFHAASSGNTERAEDVWGSEIPYLQAVESVGSQESPNYEKAVKVTLSSFKSTIKNKYPSADLSGDKTTWFKNSTRSESGGIINVYIGDVLVKGSDIRTLFKLNSTNFTIEFEDDYIIFNSLGYGHGVGMSQYGANYLAKEGMNYKEILAWYYIDTQITKKQV